MENIYAIRLEKEEILAIKNDQAKDLIVKGLIMDGYYVKATKSSFNDWCIHAILEQ